MRLRFTLTLLAAACLCMSVVRGDFIRTSNYANQTEYDEPLYRLSVNDLLRGNNMNKAVNETIHSRELDAPMSYRPGDFSAGRKSNDGKVYISNGLTCKRIATSGQKVKFANGKESKEPFHKMPDGAAVFKSPDGGWYYVSNAEVEKKGTSWQHGGVGAIQFNENGKVVGYKRILGNTKMNCGGGATPWGSWISCEETKGGRVWQVDPMGRTKPRQTDMGKLGKYESFAYDDTTNRPTFYVTRDHEDGVLTRFTPNDKGMACYKKERQVDRWCTLDHGDKDYLVLSGGPRGTFEWTKDKARASRNAKTYFPNSEGIDSARGRLYFVSKEKKRLIILDLKRKKYEYSSTRTGAFNTQPDQIERLIGGSQDLLYFCEDGGPDAGVFGRNANGKYFTILVGRTDRKGDETTGLAFGRNYRNMYVSYQEGGFIYDCTRNDGRTFAGQTLDIKYHAK